MNGITSKKSSTAPGSYCVPISRRAKRELQWYLILAVLLIQYNIAAFLLPDAGLSVPVYYQDLYALISGILLSLYFAFYLYRFFCTQKWQGTECRIYRLSGNKTRALHIAPVLLPGLFIYLDRFSGLLVINTVFLTVTFIFIKSIAHEILQDLVREKTIHALRDSEERKKAYMALVHELKTAAMLPLNYMLDYEKKYGPSQELEIIKASTHKIARDLCNYSDLEKIHRGIEVYNNEKVTDFSGSLTLAVSLFSSVAARKNIRITSEIESGLFVACDPLAAERIINNIIENAIKHTEQNKPIWIKLASVGPRLIFTVRDEGMGIPQGKQALIFEYYHRAHDRQLNPGGMGLGLPIVKQAVESLNGKIRVESTPGKGSRFTVILPAHDLSAKETVCYPEISVSSYIETSTVPDDVIIGRERPSIMVVEDNLPLLKFLRDKLSCYYNVRVADNGTHALQKLSQIIRVDLIVSDIMMEGMDGFELYKQVSEHREYGHLPFIFLSAHSDARTRARELGTGAVGYLEKPFQVNLLKKKIDATFALMERQRAALIHQAYHDLTRETFLSAGDCFDVNCKKYGFTSREKEISKLLKSGISYPAIGEELYIATNTVKKHVSHIFEKARVNNKLQLIKVLEGQAVV